MNWLAIVLIVLVAFSWLMTLALCRAARLGDEMAERMADRNRTRDAVDWLQCIRQSDEGRMT